MGARLIAHAGSLLNLAKHPASTIQILGAEKALFRALKTKHDTPKYGLIYHASLIGQAAPKNKGKISRVLAAKTALAIRVDAMGDNTGGFTCFHNTSTHHVNASSLNPPLPTHLLTLSIHLLNSPSQPSFHLNPPLNSPSQPPSHL